MSLRAWPEVARTHVLPDGRLLMRHGPIELIIEAFGAQPEVYRAYGQAKDAFQEILPALVEELPRLRSPAGPAPGGSVAYAMWKATNPFGSEFLTPMAAVAGAVADHMLQKMTHGRMLERVYVNNGGDIAVMIRKEHFRIAICDNPATGKTGGMLDLHAGDGIGGIATSGWRGRSHSLGIADAVTVLAETAAKADAAATLIANGVDLPNSWKIARTPAENLNPDSDLGRRLVTTGVKRLIPGEINEALTAGEKIARRYLNEGLIKAAYIALSGERRVVEASGKIATAHMREAICA